MVTLIFLSKANQKKDSSSPNFVSTQNEELKLKTIKLNPWFITGFIDAEGSFSVIIDKNKTRKLG